MEELANHGASLPLNMQGLNEDQWQDLHLKDEWGDICIPSGGWEMNKDIMGIFENFNIVRLFIVLLNKQYFFVVRRNGRQPKEKMQELIKKSIENVKDMISRVID